MLIVKELVHSLNRRKVDGVIQKLDFENAFDSVKWSFPLHILDCFGFESSWKRWIESILSTTRSLVLINGSPTREFGMERGLRQGDPISLCSSLSLAKFYI